MNNVLPRVWTVSNITQVVEDIRPGFACGEKNVEEGFPHLRMNNIGEEGDLVLDLLRKVPREKVKTQNILQKGDLLICTTNSSKLVGKVALFNIPGDYAFSNHLTRLRPNSKRILGEFLKWNLWLQWKSGVFDDKCKHWVNQSTIPKEVLREIEIILPPLNEQHRIVAKLEKLLAKVDACQERLEKIPTTLKRFRQSVLAAACSGRLTANWRGNDSFADGIPDHWKKCKLSDLSVLITKGASPKWQGVSYAAQGILFVTSENVGSSKMLLGTRKYVESKINEIQPRSILKKGDLLTNIVGASIGRSAIYDLDEVANINQAVALIRLKDSVDKNYILQVLNSPILVDHMNAEKVDVARANLSLKDVANFPILLPPLPEQQEIVCRVEALFKIADQIEERYKKAKTYIDKLTQSILAKAFRGELVPQDPNDKPASALLRKIADSGQTFDSCRKSSGKKERS